MTHAHDEAVLTLLHRLQTENRRYRRAGGLLLAGLIGLCTGAIGWQGQGDKGKPDQKGVIQDVLRTRRLELADARGAVVAVLQAAENAEEPGWLSDFHENGRRKWRAQIANNRYEGQFVAWWPNGLKSEEGNYVKGQKHGLFTTYHDNGQPSAVGAYSAGAAVGIWTQWHDNGKKKAEGLMEEGRKTGPWKEWHQNGQLAVLGPYKDGERDGHVQTWFENGKPQEEFDCIGGHKTGPSRAWYRSGQVRSEGAYDGNGKPTGDWKYWNEDGSVDEKKTGTYERGNRVK